MRIQIGIGEDNSFEGRMRRRLIKSRLFYPLVHPKIKQTMNMLQLAYKICSGHEEHKIPLSIIRFTNLMFLGTKELKRKGIIIPLPCYWFINGIEIHWESFQKAIRRAGFDCQMFMKENKEDKNWKSIPVYVYDRDLHNFALELFEEEMEYEKKYFENKKILMQPTPT